MNTITRRDQSRGLTLQDEVNRLFDDNFTRERSGHADLATWAPAVDIYETENELVVKDELPDFQDKDIDARITNNTLTIRGERKFETGVNEDNFLRIERAYGLFMRSCSSLFLSHNATGIASLTNIQLEDGGPVVVPSKPSPVNDDGAGANPLSSR